VAWEEADYVVIHDVGEEDQEEDEANLDEAFLEGEAEIAAADAFEGEEEDVASVEDGNGEKIQDAEIDADEGHERDDGEGALRNSFAGGAGDADEALELLGGDAAAEEFAEDAEGFFHDFPGAGAGFGESLDHADALVGEGGFGSDADLILGVGGVGDALLGRDGESESLAAAFDFELKSPAAGAADHVHELIPVVDFLAVDGADDVAGAEACVVGGRAGSDFTDARGNRVIAEGTGARIIFKRQRDGASGTVVFDLDADRGAGSEAGEERLRLFPGGIFQTVHGEDVVAGLESVGCGLLRGRSGYDDGFVEKGGVGNASDQIVGAEEKDGKEEIDGGPGDGDQGTLPAGLGHEFIGSAGGNLVAGIDFCDVLSGHADVAAERDGADAPVGDAPLEAEEARAEADREDVNADAEEAGDDEVSPFVDEDDDAENENDADCGIHAGAVPFRDSI